MRKFIIVLLAGLIFSTSVSARWYGGYHHRRKDCCYASDVAAGIVGTAAGVMIAEELMETRHTRHNKPVKKVYIYEPEGKCYTVVSRKTGKITQECVENASSDIIYVD